MSPPVRPGPTFTGFTGDQVTTSVGVVALHQPRRRMGATHAVQGFVADRGRRVEGGLGSRYSDPAALPRRGERTESDTQRTTRPLSAPCMYSESSCRNILPIANRYNTASNGRVRRTGVGRGKGESGGS